MTRGATEARPSEARQRLLGAAIRIFYAEGIHAVGVDRIIAEAKVTRATFYRHFPSKDDLVVTYLQEVHQMERGAITAAIAANATAADSLLAVGNTIAGMIRRPGFRGLHTPLRCHAATSRADFPAEWRTWSYPPYKPRGSTTSIGCRAPCSA